MAFANEIAEIVGRITGAKPAVATPIGGTATAIAWISQAESLAQMDERVGKLMADAAYRTTLKKAENVLVSGMTHDHIWRHM